MSDGSLTTAPLAAFGDPQSGLWAIAVAGAEPLLVTGHLDGSAPVAFAAATLDATAPDAWTVSADTRTLRFAAASEPSAATAGPIELCRVTGTLTGAEGPVEVDHDGVRCPALDAGRLDSLRLIATWFPEGIAAALVALRPVGAKGQDRDSVAAAISGEPAAMRVFDPRLSTTYGGDGSARHAGIELWLGEQEDGDLYPRRFAGEMLGGPAAASAGGLALEAYPLRCHGRTGDGAGVYLLARPA